ncbi:hypothetical protein [uncultured Martelella sp.]|uniref:hypothetical protein n=1 Tax=uncultured Martelella sp. TaxID=392331 RepID=UPI0029C64926|nr:hypothetical protein [uncultured Martelella sp.]
MDRITGTAVADLGGGKRGFQDEILSTGGGSQEGTVVTAQWLTSVQEEIMAVIEAAGLEPDVGSWTQLRKAISTLIATAVGAVDLSGYTTDEALAAALASYVTNPTLTAALANYLSRAGGTMTGPLTLDSDPAGDLHAATKRYVDDALALATTNAVSAGLGVGQTWQDMKSMRTSGTAYQNTLGKPIMVYIFANNTGYASISSDGVTYEPIGGGLSSENGKRAYFIVPVGHYYRAGAANSWLELR